MSYFKRLNLEYSNLNLQWFRKGFIWMLIILGVVLSGCEEDEEYNGEYYVKYIIKSSTPYGVSRNAIIKSENNSNIDFTFNNSKWEMTVGPVQKGFIASCAVSYDTHQILARTHIDVEIYVSKNNSPFALKVADNSTDPRMSASAYYTLY